MPQSARPRYFAGLSRNTFLLACASLFADISTEMLYPVLPVFLTQVLGASGSVVGLIDGVAQATQNIVQGFSGWLSDRLQRRKPIALAGYVLAAIAKPLMGLSTSWPGVLGGRFLDRLGTGARSAPRDALVASSADEEHRGKAFGLEASATIWERSSDRCWPWACSWHCTWTCASFSTWRSSPDCSPF
jgi:MFS family permease